MGLLDRFRSSDRGGEEPVDRVAQDLARYRYLVRTAPVEVLRRCLEEARSRMPEDARGTVDDVLAHLPQSQREDPAVVERARGRLRGLGHQLAGPLVGTMSASAAMSGFLQSPEAKELGIDQVPEDAVRDQSARGGSRPAAANRMHARGGMAGGPPP